MRTRRTTRRAQVLEAHKVAIGALLSARHRTLPLRGSRGACLAPRESRTKRPHSQLHLSDPASISPLRNQHDERVRSGRGLDNDRQDHEARTSSDFLHNRYVSQRKSAFPTNFLPLWPCQMTSLPLWVKEHTGMWFHGAPTSRNRSKIAEMRLRIRTSVWNKREYEVGKCRKNQLV